MKRLQEMAVKASSVAMNINLMLLGQPVYTPVRYDSLIKSSYNRNIWVYACVRAISEAASSIPLVLYKRDKGGKLLEIEQHPLLDLLRNPNTTTSEIEHRQAVIAYLLLSGNSYEEIVYGLGKPLELHAWRPDRTAVVPDREGIRALRYTVNGLEKDLDYQYALHHKMFSADNDYYGLSPLEVARISVDMDNTTQDWNTSLLQNSGAPSGILVAPDERKLSDAEYKRLSRAVRRMFSGIRNVGKPQLLEGGVKWEQLGLSPKDMDFISSRRMTREEICAIFRTPPQIVGIQDNSTYANYQEARGAFYTDSVLPTLDRLIAVYNQKLIPLFKEEGLFLGYDRDQIEALQENADQKFSRVKDAYYLTFNERREAVGYAAVDGGNVFLIPQHFIAVGPDAHYYQMAQNNGAKKQKQQQQPVKDNSANGDKNDTEKSLRELLNLMEQKKKIDQERNFLKAIDAKREAYVEKMVPHIHSKLLQADLKRTVKSVQAHKSLTKGNVSAVIKSVTQAIDDGLTEWDVQLNAMLLAVAEDFAKASGIDIGQQVKNLQYALEKKEDSEDAPAQFSWADEKFESLMVFIRKYVAMHVAEEIKFIRRTTIDALKGIIEDGMDEGLSLGQIVKEIRALDSTTFSRERAYTIARTEVLSASSYANQMGAKTVAKDAKMDLTKTWITSMDGRERSSHRATHHQTVGMEEYYTVGIERAMYPGDSRLSAKNRIRCRCAERYQVKKEGAKA